MSRAQDIANEILSSERYARAFQDRLYRDEPILRTGAQAYGGMWEREEDSDDELEDELDIAVLSEVDIQRLMQHSQRLRMPKDYAKMRALGRKSPRSGYGYLQTASSAKLFYEQGKLMEEFEDDFDGTSYFNYYYPTYDAMSDYDLRCYFTWRTHYRKGEELYCPVSFLYIHAYELLCGIGVVPGEQGYAALGRLAKTYEGIGSSFDSHMAHWMHDYVIFHGLPKDLLSTQGASAFFSAVGLVRSAERVLLAQKSVSWPDDVRTVRTNGPAQGGSVEEGELPALPEPKELLDALCSLSRYRAEKSRFVKAHKDDVADVCAHVFGRMVEHCSKRRKVDYVEGLFGSPTKSIYTMYSSAVYWSPEPHIDVEYEVSDAETFTCDRGFWWRVRPCRHMDTSKELGSLLHAIDTRMRLAVGDSHPLKARPLPKYQAKFVDDEIAAHLARKAAVEAAQIHIDRKSLGNIRSAAVRTREALLTDEERGEEVVAPVVAVSNAMVEAPLEAAVAAPPVGESTPLASNALGLTAEQLDLLRSLVAGEKPERCDALFLSLAVDAINEAFLDVVGDTVLEFDEDDQPVLVEDYVDDVREALGDGQACVEACFMR